MAQETGASLSIRNYGVPLYIVGPNQPCVVVRTINSNPALRRAFEDVPLPPHAEPALGTDGHLALWQPSRDAYWEFFRLANEAGAWQTQYGGRIVGLSHNPGYFVPLRSPSGAVLEQPGWGATATSLPLLGGLITFADLRRGSIDHALAFAVPRVRRGVMAWPAQRSDGHYGGPSALPEGARFRIDPKLHLRALHLSPLALMMARAAQRYGMIIRDGSSRISVYGQAPAGGRLGPYRHLMRGREPYNVLDGFPWSRMQLIRMKLRPDDQ
jgi:hypothetical protein